MAGSSREGATVRFTENFARNLEELATFLDDLGSADSYNEPLERPFEDVVPNLVEQHPFCGVDFLARRVQSIEGHALELHEVPCSVALMGSTCDWRKSTAAMVLLVGACGLASLPEPITDEEVDALGVEQGIAGRAAMRSGDCMPGCGLRTCSVGPIPHDVVVFEPEPRLLLDSFFVDGGVPDCGNFGRWGSGRPLPISGGPQTIATLTLQDKDTYGLALEVGTYQVAVVDASGCAHCVSSVETGGGVWTCGVITVAPDEVTHVNLLMDVSAQ